MNYKSLLLNIEIKMAEYRSQMRGALHPEASDYYVRKIQKLKRLKGKLEACLEKKEKLT